MEHAHSKDGTVIAYERSGQGPAVIVVEGAMGTREDSAALARLLAPHFTVFAYDRRGRGNSADTPPYTVEREVEDIDTLNQLAGGEAFVYGHSSGAVLALEAAARGVSIRKLALYEPPFIVDDSHPPLPADYVPHLEGLIAEGRRGDAVEYFMRAAIGIPDQMIAGMRQAPMWAGMEKVAHTISYDGRVMGDGMSGRPIPAGRWASVMIPTLVMVGGASEPWIHNSTQALALALPKGQKRNLEGQTHAADPAALAPVLVEFFRD